MNENKATVVKKIGAFRAAFLDSLGDRLQAFEALIETLTPDISDMERTRTLQTLSGLSHKLAGAAGTFGLPMLSDIARHLENLSLEVAGFIEPLESTGLYLSDLAAVMLTEYFPFHGDREPMAYCYNRIIANRFHEILDFINLHYL